MRMNGHMGITLFAAAVASLTFAGQAFARPDVRTMNCAQAQALVEQSGAVVLTTGRYTYNRFVTGPYYCGFDEVAKLTWVQTQDAAQCPVGYTCQQNVEVDPSER